VVTEFGRIVERLRESVSAHLYRLVVMECGLMAELCHVWEVFTLARGEIFHAFIQLADKRLSGPPGPSTQHDTNLAWHNAILQHSDTETDAIMTRASLLVSRDNAHVPGWDQLSVQYAVPWPLHLIITPQAIEKYNSIFKFLLLVRRTQSALHSLWADSMFRDRAVRRREVREVMSEEEREDTVTQTRQPCPAPHQDRLQQILLQEGESQSVYQ